MGAASARRFRGPASVLVAILLLALASWFGPPSGSEPSDPRTGVATSEVPSSEVPSSEVPSSAAQREQASEDSERRAPPDQDPASPSASRVSPESFPDSLRVTVPELSERDGDVDLLYGLLRQVAAERYLSPAGLIYGPGSAEGHRLEHLRRHVEDDPGRPGSHGVFEGGMEGALRTIDLAYQRAKAGQRTTTEVDGERTIHTVDLGKRIGYVGGSEGRRRRNPMARRVRLVLEGKYVVTAFPL